MGFVSGTGTRQRHSQALGVAVLSELRPVAGSCDAARHAVTWDSTSLKVSENTGFICLTISTWLALHWP